MSAESPLESRVEGLVFPQKPRWHDEQMWFSDVHARRVYALDVTSNLRVVCQIDSEPGGLGWLPDGRLLVISTKDRRLLRLDSSGLVEVADLTAHTGGHCNDLVVDALGRAYVTNHGFDLDAGEDERPANILMVEPDGTVHVVAEGLRLPNGLAITADGKSLLVAETFARRILHFDIEPDGWLSNGQVFADVDPNYPDSICLDSEGGVWVADPVEKYVFRVEPGGTLGPGFPTGAGTPYGLVFGGVTRKILYVTTSESADPAITLATQTGRLEVVGLPYAGAGTP